MTHAVNIIVVPGFSIKIMKHGKHLNDCGKTYATEIILFSLAILSYQEKGETAYK